MELVDNTDIERVAQLEAELDELGQLEQARACLEETLAKEKKQRKEKKDE